MKQSFNALRIILLAFIILSNGLLYTQEEEIVEEEIVDKVIIEKEVINLSKLADLMQSDESEIIISDYEIISSEQDDYFLVDKVFFSLYQIFPKDTKAKKLYFYNCKFNLADNAPLVFKDWHIVKLNLIGCEFMSPIGFENFKHTGRYPFLIENCIFNDEIKFTNEVFDLKSLIFKNNEFKTSLLIDLQLEKLVIDKCRFLADNTKFTSRDNEKTYYQLILGQQPVEYIELTSSTFDNKDVDNIFSIDFETAEIGELIMISNQLQTLNLTSAEVEKSLLIDSLFVDDYIGILNFDFPEANTNVPWYNFSDEKFAIFCTDDSELVIPYQAKTDKQLSNNLRYNDLISAYSKFNTLYHDRGDISSANSSYVEIKSIETRKQAFIQKINPSLNNLINYKLNVFLRFFSDYATNPGKSLKQSLWVLLIFTLLYMISFSGWDGMNYKYYYRQFNIFSDYITSNNSIAEVLAKEEHQINDYNKDIKEFLKEYSKQGKEIPRILKLFGEPIHFLGKFRYDVIPSLIRFFNFQPRKWKSLNNTEKIWSGSLIIFISLSYLFYILIVKFLNSIILSLNSFVVIGFGNIPEKGLAMYLSIIEGIIGWFLLTIFTITLLSQVLQST